MNKLFVLVVSLLLTSCASLTGNASYSYAKKLNGDLIITVDSGRNIKGGVRVGVKPNGELEISAESIEQGESAFKALSSAVLEKR